MKSIEEKARAYDETLERAKIWQNHLYEIGDKDYADELNYIFPELKESEDDKLREQVVYAIDQLHVCECTKDKLRAWLEKQGEHLKFLDKIWVGDKVTRNENGVLVNLSQLNRVANKDEKQSCCFVRWKKNTADNKPALNHSVLMKNIHGIAEGEWNGNAWVQYRWYCTVKDSDVLLWAELSDLEKQGEQKSEEVDNLHNYLYGEQKPADNVETKFKVGDWVVYDHRVYQVVELPKEGYINLGLRRNGKIEFAPSTYCRPWTIQDAKDGDVLSYRDGQWIFIYKEKIDDSSFSYHALYSTIHQDLTINDAGFTLLGDAIIPATKEQRDTLMKAMADAGYIFDFEKKELKKIEQKNEINIPFGAKDSEFLGANYCIPEGFHAKIKGNRVFIKKGEQKSTWSEEDEEMFDYALDMIEWYSGKNEKRARLVSEWLKSLKDRVQPKQEWSEEDVRKMRAIVTIINSTPQSIICSIDQDRESLCNWLKSLRPQSWSKEDKERYISCLQRLGTGNPKQPETINSKWFKEHVYSRSVWKPSDEQMKVFEELVEDNNQRHFYTTLRSLYEQLKKLREE